MFADAEALGLAFEGGPVRLAVAAHDHGVGRADDEVNDIGERLDHRRQCADDRLDPFVGAQEPERQQHPLARHAELGLQPLLVPRRHLGDPVRDDLDLSLVHPVRCAEQIRRDLAHDDEPRALPGHLLDDRSLRV